MLLFKKWKEILGYKLNTSLILFSIIILSIYQLFFAHITESEKNENKIKFTDAHIHNGFIYANNTIELSNFKYFEERGVNIICYPLPVNRVKTPDLLSIIKKEIKELKLLSEQTAKFEIVESAENIQSIDEKKIKMFLNIEYFYGVFSGNPKNVKEYRKLGVRTITLIDNQIDRFFVHNNLTGFGKQIINEMNEHGILIDISHLSESEMIEVIKYSKAPVIASHSCVKAKAQRKYNLSDKVLKLLKDKNGYVFVSFNANDLFGENDSKTNGIERLVNHLIYLRQNLEINNIGIGSDYQANGKYVPESLNMTDTYRQIQASLNNNGFSNLEAQKIMHTNFIQLMK